jgi:hypothetical protein
LEACELAPHGVLLRDQKVILVLQKIDALLQLTVAF